MLALAWTGTASAAPAPLSASDVAIYRTAYQAAYAGRWNDALAEAGRAHDQLPAKVLLWYYLDRKDSGASFDEITHFIEGNPDWPGPRTLRGRAEDAMPDSMAPSSVRAWFEQYPPVSATGMIRSAEALLASSRPVDQETGLTLLRKAWVEGNLGESQKLIFLFRHHQQLRPQDDLARLDRLLWDGQLKAARDQEHRVDAGHAALAEARIALQELSPGVEYALRRVPASLQYEPGLLFDRLRWRRHKGMDDEARQILFHPPSDLVRPEAWWKERSIEARRALAQGYYSEALRLAEGHGQSPGSPGYAEGEWLAGWIELRFFKEVEQALRHFQAMANAVHYPASVARADYWLGRAEEADGENRAAAGAYRAAAQFMTTFYGQLAAQNLDPGTHPVLPPAPPVTAPDRAAFDHGELVRAARDLGQLGEDDLLVIFLKRLGALAKSASDQELVAELADEQGRPDIAVRLTRRDWHGDVPLAIFSYPVTPLPTALPNERALVLSIIRQESAFEVGAISRAGAIGLMQLLPATARKTAKELGLGYSDGHLITDPQFNIRLGSAYMAKLLADFNGNYVLALAAYNAGPSRVEEWIRENGDPRATNIDTIDWIELIPFEETRNYVQHVLEALHVYRARLGEPAKSRTPDGDLSGPPRPSELTARVP